MKPRNSYQRFILLMEEMNLEYKVKVNTNIIEVHLQDGVNDHTAIYGFSTTTGNLIYLEII